MMDISMRRVFFWGSFGLFVCIALATHWNPALMTVDTTIGQFRAGLITVWIAFLGYSIYCIPHESLWQSAQKILKLYWGRQVTADLYISVFLSISLVWLVTGSAIEALVWGLAFIPFANLAILLFIILHLDEIISAFGMA